MLPKQLHIENTPVYLVGDIHTDYRNFKVELEESNLHNCILFFLGDMNFRDYETSINQFKKLDAELYERNIQSYIIRGNHDNPYLWNDKSFWNNFKSFKPVNCDTRLNINGNIGIIIDGAVTLNRELLDEGVNYWPEYDKPGIPWDFVDYGENLKRVDFVLGHGGPVLDDFFKQKTGCEKFLKDGLLCEDLKREQKIYRQILQRYRPKRWYCGHYHMSKDTKFVWDNWSDDGVIHLKIVDKHKILRIA